jgi:hypothetical protein
LVEVQAEAGEIMAMVMVVMAAAEGVFLGQIMYLLFLAVHTLLQ